jgi:light-regulated signal transduction histidine kinase (bacteriophytochrome)
MRFRKDHGLSKSQSLVALSRIEKAEGLSRRLRASDNGFERELSGKVARAADHLAHVAEDLTRSPRDVRQYNTLISRADLVVEAVEKHAALRGARGATTEDVTEARRTVRRTLSHFLDVVETSQTDRIDAKLEILEVTTGVANDLLKSMKRN